MTFDQFYHSTPSEFYNRFEGWKEVQEAKSADDWRRQRKHIWFMTRLITGGYENEYDVFPLPGDPETDQKKKLTDEEVEKIFEKWDKIPIGQGRPVTAKDFK